MTQTALRPDAGTVAAEIEIQDVGITFGSFEAVKDITLSIQPGEFVCLLGPSGCGKSTLLSMIAGFLSPTSGQILRQNREVGSHEPDLGFVFQSSEVLFDWLTVRQNVGFGPKMRGAGRAEITETVDQYLELVGLTHAADKYPSEISGGMRQRVQIARVLANEPEVVLMDEPFGALDAQTRTVMQEELDRIWRAKQSTVVFVTHDIDEALILGDRIVVMTAGPSAGLKSIYDVGLDRPRNQESADYLQLRRVIREDITAEVAASMRTV